MHTCIYKPVSPQISSKLRVGPRYIRHSLVSPGAAVVGHWAGKPFRSRSYAASHTIGCPHKDTDDEEAITILVFLDTLFPHEFEASQVT
jgi:hypothetical protein